MTFLAFSGSGDGRAARTSYRPSTTRRISVASISENPAPMQRRTPPPKGIQLDAGAGCSPRKRSAWLRFAERLDELAAFAAGLHPAAGTDAVVAVSAAFGRTASDLMAHIEAV